MSMVLIMVCRLLYLNKAITRFGYFEDLLIPLVIVFVHARGDGSLRMKEESKLSQLSDGYELCLDNITTTAKLLTVKKEALSCRELSTFGPVQLHYFYL